MFKPSNVVLPLASRTTNNSGYCGRLANATLANGINPFPTRFLRLVQVEA